MEENNGVFIDKEDIYNKKINIISPKTKESEVDISNNIYDNIIALGTASQFDLSSINSLTQQANTRNEMYNRYDTMCEDGRISSVIQTYAEDATERNDTGDIVWATSDDAKISYLVNYYLDSLNVNKNIYKWAFSLCKYGDLYIRLYRESEYEDALFAPLKKKSLNEDLKIKAFKENDKYAHYIEMVTNPAEMFELTKFGKTVGYIQSPVDGVIVRSQQNLDFMNYAYKFKKQDITLYPPTEFVHAAIEDNIGRFDETVDIFLNTEDYNSNTNANSYSVKRGQSLLASAYKIWRELQLLESSVLLNRVTKSSIVRLINVEVGDMPKENVSKTLMGIKQMIEQKAAINTGFGMTEYTNPGPIENNVYVPTHDGVGTISSTQIGGDVDVKSLADLDWYLNKLYGALKVPKQYFSQVDDAAGFSGGQSLTIISSRYAKTVKHIQTTLCQMITDLINLILLDKKLDSYINKFEIHMQPPVTQEDIDRRESQSTKVQLTSDIMDMLSDIEEPISRLRILKNLLVNIVNDNDIIEEIQSQINTLEEKNSEEITDTADVMTKENDIVTDDNNVDNPEESPIYFDTDDTDELPKDEVVLPSAEELGINLADDEE
jgi:hypothetical protein